MGNNLGDKSHRSGLLVALDLSTKNLVYWRLLRRSGNYAKMSVHLQRGGPHTYGADLVSCGMGHHMSCNTQWIKCIATTTFVFSDETGGVKGKGVRFMSGEITSKGYQKMGGWDIQCMFCCRYLFKGVCFARGRFSDQSGQPAMVV